VAGVKKIRQTRHIAEVKKKDLFRVVAQQSPLGLMILEYKGRMVYANKAARRILDLPPRPASRMPADQWLSAFQPKDRAILERIIREVSFRTRPIHVAARAGAEGWIELIGKTIRSGTRQMVTMIDVSERVKAEQGAKARQWQLAQLEKLASLGTLAAGLAHEVNNPSLTIALNTGLIKDMWDSLLPLLERHFHGRRDCLVGGIEYADLLREMPRLIQGIGHAADVIGGVVSGLKGFTRIEERPTMESVNLNLVVKAAVTLMSAYIGKTSTRFRLRLAEDVPPVKGHFQGLEQVVINLLQNACQALTSPDQAVTVFTSFDGTARTVNLSLTDEGRGIDPNDLHRLTDPFFTTKRDIGGTGLGLYISQSIVESHGGSLSFSSRPAKGTTVVLSLPAAPPLRR
jgi:PAS domain S-box-containing protein